jgi:hypothetical protein
MSKARKNITVTVNITNGIASFSYLPDDNINIIESTDVVFTLSDSDSTDLSFAAPLVAYVPIDASRDITANLSEDKQILTLSDTDLDQEEIAVQLVVQDIYGNTYASPDPRIVNKPD